MTQGHGMEFEKLFTRFMATWPIMETPEWEVAPIMPHS